VLLVVSGMLRRDQFPRPLRPPPPEEDGAVLRPLLPLLPLPIPLPEERLLPLLLG
jgi:hypothetical protein